MNSQPLHSLESDVAEKIEFDRSMRNMNVPATYNPTEGNNAPVRYNNRDEVWVHQVRTRYIDRRSMLVVFPLLMYRLYVAVPTESSPPSQP